MVYINKIRSTTFNIAPSDWRQRMVEDVGLMADWRKRKIAQIEDYIGKESSRLVVTTQMYL